MSSETEVTSQNLYLLMTANLPLGLTPRFMSLAYFLILSTAKNFPKVHRAKYYKATAPHLSNAEKLSFEWLQIRISSTDAQFTSV